MSGIKWLKSTDSTNSAMREQAPELDNLSVIATHAQNKGRGQGDHTWYATPGKNLTFSVLMRFSDGGQYSLPASEALTLTRITTLALRDYLLSRGIEPRIKWPNDIWVGDRKICGILIENSISQGLVTSSIVGIGLNVNETLWPEDLPNPVSMSELTGVQYCLEPELEALAGHIGKRYLQAGSERGTETQSAEFAEYMFRLEEKA